MITPDFRVGDTVELRVKGDWSMTVLNVREAEEVAECGWLDTLGHLQVEALPFKALRNYTAGSRREAKTNPAHRDWLVQQGLETE